MFDSKTIFTKIPILLVKKTVGGIKLLDTSKRLDNRSGGLIQNALQSSNKDIITVFFSAEDQASAVIIAKVEENFDNKYLLDLGVKIFYEASKLNFEQFYLIDETGIDNILNLIYLGFRNSGYETHYKIQNYKKSLTLEHKDEKSIAIAEGVKLAQYLILEPANVLNPDTYIDFIKKEFSKLPSNISISILDQALMKAYNMNALLSVSAASKSAYSVIIELNKPTNDNQSLNEAICLIGKGVTFDSGGLCIKPSRSMLGMHQDMAGSAAVLGIIKALLLSGSNKHVIGILGIVENLIGSEAYKPGDIIASSAESIEITDTDAEGRLVLADLLLYAQDRLGVKKIIDIATLTGAAGIALGDVYAPIFSNNNDFVNKIISAGEITGEFLHRMPLSRHYEKLLESNVADFVNTPVTPGNPQATVGAMFLQKFIKKDVMWAHIDIGGVNHGNKDRSAHQLYISTIYDFIHLN